MMKITDLFPIQSSFELKQRYTETVDIDGVQTKKVTEVPTGIKLKVSNVKTDVIMALIKQLSIAMENKDLVQLGKIQSQMAIEYLKGWDSTFDESMGGSYSKELVNSLLSAEGAGDICSQIVEYAQGDSKSFFRLSETN